MKDLDQLQIEIQGNSDGAETEIDQLVRAVSVLTSQVTTLLSPLSNASAGVANIGEQAKKSAREVSQLNRSMGGKLMGSSAMLSGSSDSLNFKQASREARGLNRDMTDMERSMSNITNLSKKFGLNLGKANGAMMAVAGTAMALFVGINESMKYTETFNLFEQSLAGYAEEAFALVEKLNNLYAIDPTEAMNAMGIFNQMAKSLGLTSENAYILSKNFVGLGLDMASFYNLSNQEAFTKLRAGLAGESEPLRRIGIIITENNLAREAELLGIDKSLRKMTEAEKIHLRYNAIMRQATGLRKEMSQLYGMSEEDRVARLTEGLAGNVDGLSGYLQTLNMETIAQQAGYDNLTVAMKENSQAQLISMALTNSTSGVMGDLARTIESPANQMKMLVSNVKQVARSFADVLMPVIGGILPYLNALAIALRTVLNAFKTLFGIKTEEFKGVTDFNVAGGMTSGVEDVNSGLDSAKKKAKELKGLLFGFDEVNTIPDPPETPSAGGNGGGGGGIGGLGDITDMAPITDIYGDFLTDMKSKATDLAVDLLNLIGLKAKLLEDGSIEIDFSPVKKFFDWFKESNIMKTWDMFVDALEWGLINVLRPIGAFAGAIFLSFIDALDGVLATLNPILEKFGIIGKEVWEKVLKPILGVTTMAITGLFMAFGDALRIVGKYLEEHEEVAWLVTVALTALASVFVANKLVDYMLALKDGTKELSGVFSVIAKHPFIAVAGALVGIFYSLYQNNEDFRNGVNKLVTGFTNLCSRVVELVKESGLIGFFVACGEIIGDVLNWLSKLAVEGFGNLMSSFSKLKDDFSAGVEVIKAGWDAIKSKIGELVSEMDNKLTSAYNTAETKFNNMKDKASEIWDGIRNSISEKLVGIEDSIRGSIDNWCNKFDEFKTKARETATFMWETFKENLAETVKGFVNFFEKDIKPKFTASYWGNLLSGMVSAIKQAFKDALNSAISSAETGINRIIDAFNRIFSIQLPDELGGGRIGVNIDHVELPRLARGGMVSEGQAFIAGEAGKELIGQHRGQTTVMPLENTSFVDVISSAVGDAVGNVMMEVMSMQNSNNSAEKDVIIQLDGKKLGRAIIPHLDREKSRVGSSLIVSRA